MDAERRMPRYGRLPAGLLGMLALLAGFESLVARHELGVTAPEDWQYLLARRDAARRAKGCDLLILGDSLAKFAVLPRVVEARSGLRSYNLAIGGAQAPASYEVLRRALAGGARPSAVVVDFSPFLLAKRPRASRGRLPFLLGYGAALRLGWASRDPALVADLLTRRALPSLRCRAALRSWVRSSLAGLRDRDRSPVHEAIIHWARNDGAMVMPAMRGLPVSGVVHQGRYYPRGWVPDRVNVDYVRRFLRLAEAHGVAVYWLIPPVHPAVEAAVEEAGFDARFVAFVRREQRRAPGLVVLDGRHAGYEPGVFFDPDHLGREGAFALSEDLGDLLRRLRRGVPSDRWVTLPRYRPRSTPPDLLAARPEIFRREPGASATR